METKETRKRIIQAGHVAVQELIKIAEEPIITDNGKIMVDGNELDLNNSDLPADKLKNAAATKKLAIFDAFDILQRIEEEDALINGETISTEKQNNFGGFAEKRSKK